MEEFFKQIGTYLSEYGFKLLFVSIRREIAGCLHHVEALNMDAFNQYEKATKLLRKSLADIKLLMKKHDTLPIPIKASSMNASTTT